jgi:hypothetical protein
LGSAASRRASSASATTSCKCALREIAPHIHRGPPARTLEPSCSTVRVAVTLLTYQALTVPRAPRRRALHMMAGVQVRIKLHRALHTTAQQHILGDMHVSTHRLRIFHVHGMRACARILVLLLARAGVHVCHACTNHAHGCANPSGPVMDPCTSRDCRAGRARTPHI